MMIVKTTVGSRADAKRIARALLSSGFAGCVSFWEVESAYIWEGKKIRGKEFLIEAKCKGKKEAKKATGLLLRIHPYGLPMVASCNASVNRSYGRWLSGK
jgi:uncharacterized protein involved in tolerance to divalent cations